MKNLIKEILNTESELNNKILNAERQKEEINQKLKKELKDLEEEYEDLLISKKNEMKIDKEEHLKKMLTEEDNKYKQELLNLEDKIKKIRGKAFELIKENLLKELNNV